MFTIRRQAAKNFSTLHFSSPLGNLGRRFSSTITSHFNEVEGYEKLLKSSEREKVDAIAKAHLLGEQTHPFVNNNRVEPRELLELLYQVNRTVSFPIKQIGDFHGSSEFLHFRDNPTFVNLPYDKKTSDWSDRNALQRLIREQFNKLFQGNDLVIIPGCADGQIPLEVYANSKKHDVDLEIVAADYNLSAMQLGYLTMKSFGLNSDRIHWIQTDVKSKEFFDWIGSNFHTTKRHQIITLIQPCLREKSLLAFLAQTSCLHKVKNIPTTIVMPVLLEDKNSKWYQECDDWVQKAVHSSEKKRDLPELMWNKTKYGHEMLRLSRTKEFYLPQQFFVRPQALPEIQKETGYQDANERVYDEVVSKYKFGGLAKRVFCIWKAID